MYMYLTFPQAGSDVTVVPPVPDKPASSVLSSLRHQRDVTSPPTSGRPRPKLESAPSLSTDSEENLILRECLDYQEIDLERQSQYGPKDSKVKVTRHESHVKRPPRVKIERRVFQKPDISLRSSGASDADYLDTKSSPSSPPVFKTLPRNLHLNAVASPDGSPSKTAVAGQPQRPLASRTRATSESTNRSPAGISPLHAAAAGTAASSSLTSSSFRSRHGSESDYHDYYEPPPYDDMTSSFVSSSTVTTAHEPDYATVAKYVSCDAVSGTSTEDSHAYAYPPSVASSLTSQPSHHHQQAPANAAIINGDQTPPPFLHRNIPAFATMPRRHRKDAPARFYPAHSQTMQQSELVHAATLGRSHSERRAHPPTPPSRRRPSWESRIYAIANVALQLTEKGQLSERRSRVPVTDALYANNYQQLTVPVYTTLKGVGYRTVSVFNSLVNGSALAFLCHARFSKGEDVDIPGYLTLMGVRYHTCTFHTFKKIQLRYGAGR